MAVYALKLIGQYGVEKLRKFEKVKRDKVLNPRKFYEEIIEKYKNLLKQIET